MILYGEFDNKPLKRRITMAGAILKFKPSESTDVVGYKLYVKPHVEGEVITKENSGIIVDLGLPTADLADGYIKIDLAAIEAIASLDGYFDLGVVSIDDAGNSSVMLTQGLANVGLDFVAPVPPTDGSVYYV
jgi:hypothetical protein